MKSNFLHWILRIVPAVILLQTLYFKFGAHPDSVDLFTQLGVEPWGRIGTGVLELIASILLLWPQFTRFGALLGIGLMGGAISSHLFIIGIEHAGDGGALFGMAALVLLCCLILVFVERKTLLARFQS